MRPTRRHTISPEALGHGGMYLGVHDVSGDGVPELVWETWESARERFTAVDSHRARYWLAWDRVLRAAYEPEQ